MGLKDTGMEEAETEEQARLIPLLFPCDLGGASSSSELGSVGLHCSAS